MAQQNLPKSDQAATPKSEELTDTLLAREEREFLHALSNPLAIAGGLLELLNEDLQKQGQLTEQQISRLTKLTGSLERMRELIKSRRLKLIELDEETKLRGKTG